MDYSKVGEKLLSSVRSARSLGLLPSTSDRPEVVDAYALIGDVSGLAEKIQSFFMQEVLSVTHSVLKNILQEDLEPSNMQSSSSRLTYSDLCHQIPESKFRQCLLTTLAALFKLMSSYQASLQTSVGFDLVWDTMEKVALIRKRLVSAQSFQKSYVDRRRRPLSFEVGDYVLLKISPRRDLIRFGKTSKLSPRFIGPFEILERIEEVAYHLALTP
ncbi:uncharacterized protein LOC114319189 [Camellia sinensis]|uniref:uncharacterized protein LOC114319189 n=1 Tax=Camellia sinensis TaxID=4442 RepID=UPI001035E511|nr:uncharacterized protein LOC114319189 [Camellia sinensis]